MVLRKPKQPITNGIRPCGFCLHLLHFSLQKLKMAIDGRDSNGEANRNLEELEDDYLPPNFKEYLRQEELNLSQHKLEWLGVSYFGWVFWSQKDHKIEPSLSPDNCADFNPNVCAIPKVRDNIRRALQKLILSLDLSESLVQFWAAKKTSEERTVLVSQYQPFAFGTTASMSARQKLSEYKMEMSRKYNLFYTDAESGEEQLRFPGRVFLHQFPESIFKVEYYSRKEYPQCDLALCCQIRGSLAVPMFEHSSQTCVGVLEIASLYNNSSLYWGNEVFRPHTNDIYQEFGLQCSDRYKICEMQCRENKKRRTYTCLSGTPSGVEVGLRNS